MRPKCRCGQASVVSAFGDFGNSMLRAADEAATLLFALDAGEAKRLLVRKRSSRRFMTPNQLFVVGYWQRMSCGILFARKLCQRINDDGKTFHARTRLAVRVIARNFSCPTGCCYRSCAAPARATALTFAGGSSSAFQVSVT
jgi:hypothetical protein